MPLARPVFLLLCCIAIPTLLTFFSLISAHPRRHAATESAPTTDKGRIRSFLSFHTPSSLFPPSAIISLTDDNSTFFLARPADFGPELTSKGLSGQLWVGSGFGDDNRGKGGATSGAEGELGCSDVPNWEDEDKMHRGHSRVSQPGRMLLPAQAGETSGNDSGAVSARDVLSGNKVSSQPSSDDGTDNHLHHPLPESTLSKSVSETHQVIAENSDGEHADIQSLQETAEITGKIALLSRGGCGFLEKVKWAQRRGAAALIVGDDTRGGALVTMYARGDTSNVSIPALFTSHTTAHLLSSLIPPEGYPEDSAEDGNNLDAGHNSKGYEPFEQDSKANAENKNDRPMFTPSAARLKPTSTGASGGSLRRRSSSSKTVPRTDLRPAKKTGWLRSLFGRSAKAEDTGLTGDSRRPPSSGRLNWINEKWSEELLAEKKARAPFSSKSAGTSKDKAIPKSSSQHSLGDGFEIGIQDWRDPDLVATKTLQGKGKDGSKGKAGISSASSASNKRQHESAKPMDEKVLSGGSITPGSGEYRTPGHSRQKRNGAWQEPDTTAYGARSPEKPIEAAEESWLSRVLWGDDEDAELGEDSENDNLQGHSTLAAVKTRLQKAKSITESSELMDDEEHDGLWVTLTPTTMSTTPFFDTLLVLVVSPLITLTVVYTLLLIRSRMRRRRWRAPKSVVEQLPVRTYQTMSCSSTTSSTRFPSPLTSSPTSPLLQSNSRPTAPRSRPRSRTASSISDAVSASLDKATAKASAKASARQEKSLRRYKGKQIECVVCLEEYVEGQSQVMSLPCGHEFHADCITPWLTTRRRTCPICKNDVVRSIARSTSAAPSTPMHPNQQDVEGEDVQVMAAESTNNSPSSAIPIPGNAEGDLERGDDLAETLVESQTGWRGWRGLASFSLSAFSGEAAWRQAQADRNR